MLVDVYLRDCCGRFLLSLSLALILCLPIVYVAFQPDYASASAGGDLRVASLEAIQAIQGQDFLIAEKNTVAKIEIVSTYPNTLDVPILSFFSYCGGTLVSCTPDPIPGTGDSPRYQIRPGTHTYFIRLQNAPGFSLPVHSACVRVEIDNESAVPEINEENNRMSACLPLVMTKQLRIFFVPIALGIFDAPECSKIQELASRSEEYVQGVYPIADVGNRQLEVFVSCTPLHYGNNFLARNGLDNDWRDADGNAPPNTSVPHHDAFIGVFKRLAFSGYGEGSYGQPQNNLIAHGSIVEETQIDGIAAAQEMAHNFGWVTRSHPLNDGTDHLVAITSLGYWGNKECAMGFYQWSALAVGNNPCNTSGMPNDFMKQIGNSSPNDVMNWISKPTWDFLVRSLAIDPTQLTRNSVIDSSGLSIISTFIEDNQGNNIVNELNNASSIAAISSKITNENAIGRSFIFISEVRDEQGITISLQAIERSIGGNDSLDIRTAPDLTSNTPDLRGSYSIRSFLISDFDNPQILSSLTIRNIIVNRVS